MVDTALEELPDDRARGGRDRQGRRTATAARPARHAAHPARSERRHRRLQGARVHAPGHQGRAHACAWSRPRRPRASSGPASFAGITGAPVLITEWEPDPLRGAFPGDPPPEHAPLSHLALVEHADVVPDRAGDRATRSPSSPHGHADNLLTAAALACRRPLIVAPAMNNAMYEHPATQANLATLRARGVTVLEPGTGALGSPGEFGHRPPARAARAAGRRRGARSARRRRARRAQRARHRRRHARADRRRALRRQPLLRADGARARRGGRAARRQGDGRRRQRVDPPRAPGIEYVDVETAAELAAACDARFDGADVLLMAAAVADYRPADAHAGKLKKDQTRGRNSTLAARAYRGRAVRARRRAAAPARCSSASPPSTATARSRYGRDKLERKNLDAVS